VNLADSIAREALAALAPTAAVATAAALKETAAASPAAEHTARKGASQSPTEARPQPSADPGFGPATVLLSPAAASFDMFVDYAARGAAFKAAAEAVAVRRGVSRARR
jgi:UDP-N-acetylmuramoylalanine-D-glutamate ligase